MVCVIRAMIKILAFLFPAMLWGQSALDTTLNTEIKSVQISGSFAWQYGQVLGPAVTSLGSGVHLSFDDLSARFHTYYYTIKHYNADWTPSGLNMVEYWGDFKEMPIEHYQNSQLTKVPYMHYEATVPSPKKAGNYTIVVYQSGQWAFSRKICIVDPKLTVQAQARFSQDPLKRRTHQQLDLEVNFGSYPMQNPAQELRVYVRKNYRNDDLISLPKPLQVSEATRTVVYGNSTQPLEFLAGNEYRYFDARSTFQKGFFIERVEKGNVDDLWIETQKSKARGPYIEMIDRNGLFAIATRDAAIASTQADYPFFRFGLKLDQLADKDIYVVGGFNQYQHSDATKMQYNDDFAGYTATIQLKQGVYDYAFDTVEKGQWLPNYFDGNFSETENAYEVFVYHRPRSARADVLIGYTMVQANKRK
jgi:hypothetical protein